jgi:hypothetical protein
MTIPPAFGLGSGQATAAASLAGVERNLLKLQRAKERMTAMTHGVKTKGRMHYLDWEACQVCMTRMLQVAVDGKSKQVVEEGRGIARCTTIPIHFLGLDLPT